MQRPAHFIRRSQPSPGASATSNFLARLNEAKAKRGDKSRLAIAKTSEGSHLVAEKAVVGPAGGNSSMSQTQGEITCGSESDDES